MAPARSQTLDKFILRLPDGLRDRIKLAADRSGRSMNAEIVAVLEAEYPADDAPLTLQELNDLIQWTHKASTLDEFHRRKSEVNERIGSQGFALLEQTGRDGRLVLSLVSDCADPAVLSDLFSKAYDTLTADQLGAEFEKQLAKTRK